MDKREILKSLIAHYAGGNKSRFASMLGITPQAVSTWEKRETFDVELIFAKCEDLNANWLLTGEGPMLVEESNAKLVGHLPDRSEFLPVNYVPASAHASFIENIDNSGPLDSINILPAPHEREDADNLYVFDVAGDSMSPTIQDGAQILTRRIPRKHWHYAEGVVVAVYGEFVVVKRILKNALASDNRLLLGSDNPRYSSMEIQEADLRGLFKAMRIINSKIY